MGLCLSVESIFLFKSSRLDVFLIIAFHGKMLPDNVKLPYF